MNVDLIKATLVSGEPIFINEFKIESIWLDNKDVCQVILDSGNTLEVKPSLFNNLTKESGV